MVWRCAYIFVNFLRILDFLNRVVIFMYLVAATLPSVFNKFIWNVVGFFGMVWRCTYRFVNFLREMQIIPFADLDL